MTRALLDRGYAVIAPAMAAQGPGGSWGHLWETNLWDSAWAVRDDPPALSAWNKSSTDHPFLISLLEATRKGSLGPIDMGRLHAAGFSSGGYMASRLAFQYPGTFASIALVSASYFYCPTSESGECDKPLAGLLGAHVSAQCHAPALILHCEGDELVPRNSSEAYAATLADSGVQTDRPEISEKCGHEWPGVSARLIVDWFDGHTIPPAGGPGCAAAEPRTGGAPIAIRADARIG